MREYRGYKYTFVSIYVNGQIETTFNLEGKESTFTNNTEKQNIALFESGVILKDIFKLALTKRYPQ